MGKEQAAIVQGKDKFHKVTQPCAVIGSSTPSGVTNTAPTSGFSR